MSVCLVVFTDLDATLLEQGTYSFLEAWPALKRLKKLKIPVIMTTSKTRAETEAMARKLRLNHPFIVENGGAVIIPKGYFASSYFKILGLRPISRDRYEVIPLGTPYRKLRKALARLGKKISIRLVGFGDLTADQIAALTGLKKNEARLAGQREFDEPFFLDDNPAIQMLEEKERKRMKTTAEKVSLNRWTVSQAMHGKEEGLIKKEERWPPAKNSRQFMKRLQQEAKKFGLKITEGGRFYHLTGNNDKGKAVLLLKKLYRLKFGRIVTIGLGDSANDWPMLKEMDFPVLVARPDGSHWEFPPGLKNIYRTREPGPRGWAEAVEYLLSRLEGVNDGSNLVRRKNCGGKAGQKSGEKEKIGKNKYKRR
ncbi:MAG: HAD-IIB family hydrolase [Candidatus Saccharicenans sp.]